MQDAVTRNKLIVVLGMHRGGTSAVARGLKVLGANLGERLLPPVETDNKKGYWEDTDVNALNISMLTEIGADWHSLTPISSEENDRLCGMDYFDRAVALVKEKIAAAPVFGLKDPRLGRLLPFWRAAFSQCDIEVNYVVALRNPLSVAQSLAKRDGFDMEKSLYLWLEHMIPIMDHTRGSVRTIIDYDNLMRAPELELRRVAEIFGLRVDDEALTDYKTQFLDPHLQHNSVPVANLLSSADVPGLVKDVYPALLDVASGRVAPDQASFETELQRWVATLDQSRVALTYIDRLSRVIGERSLAVSNMEALLADRDRSMVELEGQLAEREQAVTALEGQLVERTQAVTALEGQLAERTQAVTALEGQLAERAQAVTALEGQLAERTQAVTALEGQLADRTQAMAALEGQLAERTQAMAALEGQLAERTQAVTALENQLSENGQAVAEVEGQLTRLAQVVAGREAQVTEILGSTCWRMTHPLRVVGYQVHRARAAYRFGSALLRAYGGPLASARTVAAVMRRDGLRGVAGRLSHALTCYKATGWPVRPSQSPSPLEPASTDAGQVAPGLTISIIMPVYNTPISMLDESIMSVRTQTYENWELVVVDDNSSDPQVAATIAGHAAADSRIRSLSRSENGNISTALNSGLALVTGEFVAVLDHDDLLDKDALHWVARTISANPSCDYIYTDEDKISKDGDVCYGPFYKPDWSPEYFLAMMYTCHLGVYRTSILREIGGYRSEFDGAQDYDLTLRFLSRTDNVVHIPKVLYHWRVWEQSTAQSLDAKPYAEQRARKALVEILESKGELFTIADGPQPGHHQVTFLPRRESLVSVVIPTANGVIDIGGRREWHLDAVYRSIEERTKYPRYEVVIVHNGDLRDDQLEYFLAKKNVKLVSYESDHFSLSEKINLGCKHAAGEYLVIMNDDIRVISEDWLDQMVGMVQRAGVGVVGPKLLFPDNTIQHAGVVLLGGLPGHAYYGWPKDADGYALGAKVNRNYLAVTGACAITPKWLFEKVGGYSARYPLNYNDVDYCLKLHELGYRSVYLANVELYHYEGVSKEGGRSVADTEIQKFLDDWGQKYAADSYYNPNLSQHAPYQFG